MRQTRDRKGRFTKKVKYRELSRWEKIIILCIFGAYIVALLLDSAIVYARELLLDSTPTVEVVGVIEELPVEPKLVLIGTKIDWTTERIKEEVWLRAEKYNTYPEKMWQTILCENPQLKPELQSLIVKDGVREDSWGLAQFHLPSKNVTADGKVITKEMAQNPEIALDAMAYHFSIGNAKLWTCYRDIYQ